MARPRGNHMLKTARLTAVGGRRHGIAATYARGCTCEPCRSAAREANAKFRRRSAAERYLDTDGRLCAPVPDHMHGKLSTYANRSCRCLRCTKARSDYHYQKYGPKRATLNPEELARLRQMVGLPEEGKAV